jgi:hypothetical protein
VDRAAVFAEGKPWHGMRRFRMRTLKKKVNTEALMTATGQNIKRLLAFGGRGPEKLAQAVALRPALRLRLDLLLAADSGIIIANDALTLRFSTRWLEKGTEPFCPDKASQELTGSSRNPLPIAESRYVFAVRFLGQWPL